MKIELTAEEIKSIVVDYVLNSLVNIDMSMVEDVVYDDTYSSHKNIEIKYKPIVEGERV